MLVTGWQLEGNPFFAGARDMVTTASLDVLHSREEVSKPEGLLTATRKLEFHGHLPFFPAVPVDGSLGLHSTRLEINIKAKPTSRYLHVEA